MRFELFKTKTILITIFTSLASWELCHRSNTRWRAWSACLLLFGLKLYNYWGLLLIYLTDRKYLCALEYYSPTLMIGELDIFFKINGTYVSFSGYISLFDILEWNMVRAVVFGLKKVHKKSSGLKYILAGGKMLFVFKRLPFLNMYNLTHFVSYYSFIKN